MEFTDLQNALKDAMKARDTDRKEAVQTLIAAVKKQLSTQAQGIISHLNWLTALSSRN